MKIQMENVNDYMFRNIDGLIDSQKLEGKKIVLFGLNTSSYAAKSYLESKGRSVYAYIDNDKRKVEEMTEFLNDVLPRHMNAGSCADMQREIVGAYFPEQLLGEFDDDVVILIASKYYVQMCEQLQNMGYEENKHIFKTVDFYGLEDLIKDFSPGVEYREMTTEEVRHCQIGILKKVRQVCEEHGLRYYLCGGTLIGAVRHKGYIPWDDDIDVIMPYSDYLKFLELMKDDQEYVVSSQYTMPEKCFSFFGRMIDKRTVMKWWEYPFLTTSGVNIDIFAISGVPEKSEDIEHFYNKVRRLNTKYMETYLEMEQTEALLEKREVLRKEILRMLEMYDFDSSEKAFCISKYKEKEILPVSIYRDKIKMQFEDDEYDVAAGYDMYLKSLYGDYMKLPPANQQVGCHNYKAFVRKDKRIKVSIITPVYNSEQYLRQCVDSCINQTLEDIEILLVDDASKDGSPKIMKEYESKYPGKVKCIYLKENMRPGGARNKAIDIARGEYITFVDSDDYIANIMCEELYQYATETDCDVVCCNYKMIRGKRQDDIDLYYNPLITRKDDKTRRILMSATSGEPMCKLIKRELMLENNIYFPQKLKYMEDMATIPFIWYYAKRVGKIEKSLYYYVRRDTSITMTGNSSCHKNLCEVIGVLKNEFEKRGLKETHNQELQDLCLRMLGLEFKRFIDGLDIPDKQELVALYEQMISIVPDYTQSKVLGFKNDPREVNAIRIFFDSPERFYALCMSGELKKANLNYYHYYAQYQDKIQRLFRYCQERNNKVGIWGAGGRGLDFLQVCDNPKKSVDFVFDKNQTKIGQYLETGHQVSSYAECCSQVDVILVMNKVYYTGIRDEIRRMNDKVRVVDLDFYLYMDEDIENWLE